MGAEKLPANGTGSLDRPACNELLYQLHYPCPPTYYVGIHIWGPSDTNHLTSWHNCTGMHILQIITVQKLEPTEKLNIFLTHYWYATCPTVLWLWWKINIHMHYCCLLPLKYYPPTLIYRAGITYLLQAARSRDRISVGARFSAPVLTGSGAHPAFYTMGTGFFLGFKVAMAWQWPPTPI
jgi:hypothetical protein